MPHPYLIAPSILSADFTHLGADIQTCQQAGADWIHVDVMDGHFVPNLTMGPFIVAACRRITSLPIDVHLMIEKPERLLDEFAKAGASSLTVHVETCPHLHRTLQSIGELGCHPGVTLNPDTPASAIYPVLHLVDLVLVMSVNPGFSGQAFLPESLSKLRELRRRLDEINPTARLEIDGGLNEHTLPAAIEAGADTIVAASSIFHHPQGIAAGITALRQAIKTKSRQAP